MAWARLALVPAAAESDETLQKVAGIFGYAETAQKRKEQLPKAEASSTSIDQSKKTTDSTVERTTREPARFIRVKKITEKQSQDQQAPSYLNNPNLRLKPSDSTKGSYDFAKATPLLNMSQLTPFLLNSLGQQRASRRLDQRQLSRQIAQGKAIHRLPYRSMQRWPQRLQIIVDTSSHLEPYWDDFEYIINQLEKRLGSEAVDAIRFQNYLPEDKISHCISWPTKDNDEWRAWQPPSSHTPLLILSDLGMTLPEQSFSFRWEQFAKRHQTMGSTKLSFSPASQSPEANKLCRQLQPAALHDKKRLPRHPCQQGFRVGLPEKAILNRILTLLSPLPLVDVGLLRRLRMGLEWGGSELEGLIWNHPEIRQIGLGIRVRETVAEGYRQQYQADFAETEVATKLWDIVHEHHQNVFDGLKQLEKLNECVLESVDDDGVRDYLQQLCATTSQSTAHSAQRKALEMQCRTFLASRPAAIWQSDLSDLAYDLYAMAYQDEIRAGKWPEKLEKGFDPARLKWTLDKAEQEERVTWQIHQTGVQGQLTVSQERTTTDTTPTIFTFTSPKKIPPVLYSANNNAAPISAGQLITIPSGQTIQLASDQQSVELDAIACPEWAELIARNESGLIAQSNSENDVGEALGWAPEIEEEGLNLKQIWYPLKYGSPYHESRSRIPDLFMPPSFRQTSGVSEKLLEWAREYSRDQYGLYVDVQLISDFKQRFRWIEPGSFLMGSPEDEVDRTKRETQHQVVLTEGYWLADTTVTQALWHAVMGTNPSHFNGKPNHPVEEVSWDDSQDFIQKINKQFPAFQLSLPSEAQWEYACRAGTKTPFSFGENISPEQVNYNGNYPYANDSKGEYRQQTVAVKSLPVNPWGLYEMHGNIWEWCQDVFIEDLGADSVRDPLHSPAETEKGAGRVIRGGSWYGRGRSTRSAYRYHSTPDFRSYFLGFRLSLMVTERSDGGVAARTAEISSPAASSDGRVAEQRQAGMEGGLLAGVQRFTKRLFGRDDSEK